MPEQAAVDLGNRHSAGLSAAANASELPTQESLSPFAAEAMSAPIPARAGAPVARGTGPFSQPSASASQRPSAASSRGAGLSSVTSESHAWFHNTAMKFQFPLDGTAALVDFAYAPAHDLLTDRIDFQVVRSKNRVYIIGGASTASGNDSLASIEVATISPVP